MSGEPKQLGSGDPSLSQFGSGRDSVETGGYDAVLADTSDDSGLDKTLRELTSPPTNEALSVEAGKVMGLISGDPKMMRQFVTLMRSGDTAGTVELILRVLAQVKE